MMTFPSATDYQSVTLNPKLVFQDKDLRSAKVRTNQLGLPAVNAGGFALTYFFETPIGAKWVVRCFKADSPSRKQRYTAISHFLTTHKESFLTTAEYIDQGILVNGQWYPIVKMPQLEGDTLNKFIESNLSEPQKLINLIQKFCDLVTRLEQLGIAHGDLQHGNIMVSHNQLMLIDYDGMYVPELKGHQSTEAGHRSYQHPLLNAEFWPDRDRFSTIVIYLGLKATSLNPNLWEKYSNGDNLLFQSTDFSNPAVSPLLRELETIPSIKQYAINFQTLCKLPLLAIPCLADFLAGNLPQKPAVITGLKDGNLPQLNPYPVIDATARLTLLNHVGEIVQVVGQITDGKFGNTINQTPFCFLNFGDFMQGSMALVIWSEALELFTKQKKYPKNYIDEWVSITGRLSSYKAPGRPTQPQIVIELPTQIKILSGPLEAKALMPQLAVIPDSIDFGDITNDQDKEQWLTLKNIGKGMLKGQIQGLPSWLNISAHDLQCAENSVTQIKIRTATQNVSPGALLHDLSIVSNRGNKTIKIRAKVVHTPILAIASPTLDFGEITLGQAKELSLTIQNVGKGVLESQISYSLPWLAIDQSKVHCPAGCTIKVKVQLLTKQAPNIPIKPVGNFGTYQLLSGKLVITSNGGQQTVQINAKLLASPLPSPTITPVVPILQVTPITVNFGELTLGQDKVQWLTVRNIGAGKLEIQFQNQPTWLEVTPTKASCTSTSEAIKVKLVANVASLVQGYQLHSNGVTQALSHKLSIIFNGGVQIIEVQANLSLTIPSHTLPKVPQHSVTSQILSKATQPSHRFITNLSRRILKALLIGAFIFLIFNTIMIGLPDLSNRFNKVITPFFDTTKPLAKKITQPTVTIQTSPTDDKKVVPAFNAPTVTTPTAKPMNAVLTNTPTTANTTSATVQVTTYVTALAQILCNIGICEENKTYLQSSTEITSVSPITLVIPGFTVTDIITLPSALQSISNLTATSSVNNTPTVVTISQPSCRSKKTITLLAPIDTTSDGAVTFSWQWSGTLPTGCGFEVRAWRDGETPKGVHDAIQDNLNGEIKRNSSSTYSLHVTNILATPSVQERPGEYFWTVVLVRIRPSYEETNLQASPKRFWLRLSSD